MVNEVRVRSNKREGLMVGHELGVVKREMVEIVKATNLCGGKIEELEERLKIIEQRLHLNRVIR